MIKDQGSGKVDKSEPAKSAMKIAMEVYVWPSVGLRLAFGQHHKSLFDSYKALYYNYLGASAVDS